MSDVEVDDSNSNLKKVKFKRKPLRSRQKSSSDESGSENEEDIASKLEEMKTLQKLRQRPRGVNIVGLALGKKVTSEDEAEGISDPFKTKTGGMVNLKTLKSGKIQKTDDAYETGIGTQFSAETNKRDEDEEMMKFIEEQLSKKKGAAKVKTEEGTSDPSLVEEEAKYCSPEEAALQAVPVHLRISSTQRSEEMLSNQMLSGIPEVDLGIDAKIRNIEATEEAKLKLLWNKHNKKDGPSQFVPSNITVNFVQQNKINVDDTEVPQKGVRPIKKPGVVQMVEEKVPQKRKDGEKATDDYHYERFKKQFRRY